MMGEKIVELCANIRLLASSDEESQKKGKIEKMLGKFKKVVVRSVGHMCGCVRVGQRMKNVGWWNDEMARAVVEEAHLLTLQVANERVWEAQSKREANKAFNLKINEDAIGNHNFFRKVKNVRSWGKSIFQV